ncbi:MAG: DoxX family protein [Candidatus Sungbacteria bacterium]|uniref:DoxX family protein n=1 Tax=Candidatus Sungiibacteriota bacterium TaxID=2750080 RepID=A0A932YW30_9BACT|nr:DoxX family protein [Candidatus Sungbacteria bacterium]
MFIFDYLLTYPEWGPLILRVALGGAFVAHGYPKLFKMYAGFAGWLDSIGIRPGRFWALVVGVVEFFGGIALIAGVFTQFAAFLIAINMLVAMAKAKWGKSRYVDLERMGWELDLIYFAAALALVFLGPGAYAFGW